MSQQAMADFLYEQYHFKVSRFTIGRTLKRAGWTKKVTQNIAKERNQDLRDDYIERRSHYKVSQMIFIDESGSDRGLGILEQGYAPKGVTPVQRKRFHRGKRVQMLPAYTINGVVYCEVYEENTVVEVFEGFLERLLPHCGRYPEPKSVIFMDNASLHFLSQRVKDLFARAGVIIEYQVPYSPDLNPIEFCLGRSRIVSKRCLGKMLISSEAISNPISLCKLGLWEGIGRWLVVTSERHKLRIITFKDGS